MAAAGAAAFLLPQSQAGSFTADFNDNAVPAGTFLNGRTGGGVIETGILKITKAVNDQSGGFVISDLDNMETVYGFTMTAKIRVGGGTVPPADGFSISFAPDIADDAGATPAEYENGLGSGLRIAFDIFDNGNETPAAPSIDLRVGGTVVQSFKTTFDAIRTGADFADLNLTVSPAGGVTLVYKGQTIFNNVFFPGYQGLQGPKLAITGRTGGLNENVWFDDISLTTITTPQVGIVAGPASQTVVSGTPITLTATLNNTEGATFEWLRNGTAIAGATSQEYTFTPTAADTGATFALRVTGPNNTVTTSAATLTLVDLPLPAPAVSYNFTTTDGSAPAGTTLLAGPGGGGYITFEGDPTGFPPGVLHLTDNINDNRGVFIVEDLAPGAPVYGLTANFKLRMGGGDAVPADGFSFNFASDIVDATDGDLEEGLGAGLTVTFDIYDNAGGEAPSVDVKYGGAVVASVKVPASLLNTGDDFADVIIRLQNDGTIDVAFDGVVLHNNVTVPGFTSITGGRIALAARTGGLNQNIWVDDLGLTPNTTAGDLRIATQPRSQYVIPGQTVTLSAAASATEGVTYQWLRNGAPIEGATSADYTFIAAAGDNNAQYTLRASLGALNATSEPATLTVLSITPTVSFDFNTGATAPAGTTLAGNAPEGGAAGVIVETGGVDDSGVLHLTEAANSQWGAFVVEPLLGGAEVAAINVAFDLLLRSFGTPADGISFNWAPNLPATVAGFEAEEGAGQGLTVTFDTYNNAGGEAPAIDVKWNGAILATTKLTAAEILTGDSFRKVIVKVTTDGKVDVVYGDRIVYSGLQIPDYTPITNGKYAFYGRTGGANEDAFIDNVLIEAIKSTAPLRITTEPNDALLISGQTATFNVGVSDPAGVTYQWFRNGAPITGATSATYTTPALTAADNGVAYTVTATGPGGAPTSRQAIVRVVDPLTIGASPEVSFNFDDGATPEGTTLVGGNAGGGYITTDGGVNNSGVLHLTDDAGDQGAGFYIPAGSDPISAFTANFNMRVAAAGAPADGVSFVWANEIQAGGAFGETGIGSDLVVSIDTWDNGAGEAPAFDITWQGNPVATLKVPINQILTGDTFGDVFIRVESDGTLDMQYNGRAIFSNVQLPNFEALVDSTFAIGARTGGASALQWVDDLKIDVTTGSTAPSVSIARNADGTLRIEWAGPGELVSAPVVTGPYNTVVGATSPATITPTGTMQFFQVRQPAP